MFRASLRPSSGGRTAFHCLWFLSCCTCCDAGELGGKMCALYTGWVRQHPLHSAHILPPHSPASQQLQQDRNHRQWNAARPPDDGRKEARNMLRKSWLPINHYFLHLIGFRLRLLIKDARSLEHKVSPNFPNLSVVICTLIVHCNRLSFCTTANYG